MARRRVSDEALLGAIAFAGVTAFFLSKAAVHGDEPSTAAGAGPTKAPVLPLLALLLASEAASQLAR